MKLTWMQHRVIVGAGLAAMGLAFILPLNGQERAERSTLQGHAFAVRCVVFSPDGRTVASASNDAAIKQ
jgi:WD40 repeat protein